MNTTQQAEETFTVQALYALQTLAELTKERAEANYDAAQTAVKEAEQKLSTAKIMLAKAASDKQLAKGLSEDLLDDADWAFEVLCSTTNPEQKVAAITAAKKAEQELANLHWLITSH